MRSTVSILGGAAAVFGLSAAIAQTPPVATAPATELADAPGKDRLLATCSGCHEANIVIGQHHDVDGWKDIIDQMIARGAPVSDEDHTAIADYLAKNPSTQPLR